MNVTIYNDETEQAVTLETPKVSLVVKDADLCVSTLGEFGQLFFKRIKGRGFVVYQNDFMPKKNITITNRHTTTFIGLGIMYKNELEFSFDNNKKIFLPANHFLFACLPTSYSITAMVKNKVYSTFTVHFSATMLKELEVKYPKLERLLQGALHNKFHLLYNDNFSLSKEMLAVVDEIIEDRFSKQVREMLIDIKIRELLVKTIDHIINIPTNKKSALKPEEKERMKKVPGILIENDKKNKERKAIAKRTSLNIFKLKEGFRELYGLSMQEFYKRHRFWEARCMLVYTDEPISSIAEKIGFSDTSAFSKAFKKFYSISPLHYRNNAPPIIADK